MNCLGPIKKKTKMSPDEKRAVSKAISDYVARKMAYWQIVEYIQAHSWDEKDFENNMKHYRKTGELPK